MSTGNNLQADAPKAVKDPKESKPTAEETKVSADRLSTPEEKSQTGALTVQARTGSGALVTHPAMILGNRPIAPSHLHVSHMLFGNRPVTPGAIEVAGSLNSSGTRPIATSIVKVSNQGYIMGSRPIAVSNLQVSESGYLGNRPIAPNEDAETPTLMGYLD